MWGVWGIKVSKVLYLEGTLATGMACDECSRQPMRSSPVPLVLAVAYTGQTSLINQKEVRSESIIPCVYKDRKRGRRSEEKKGKIRAGNWVCRVPFLFQCLPQKLVSKPQFVRLR
jgi:hypothetical protein